MRLTLIIVVFLYGLSVPGQSYVPEQNNKKVKINPAVPVRAYAFNLKDVQLLNSPFKHAMSMDSAYLILLKPDTAFTKMLVCRLKIPFTTDGRVRDCRVIRSDIICLLHQ